MERYSSGFIYLLTLSHVASLDRVVHSLFSILVRRRRRRRDKER